MSEVGVWGLYGRCRWAPSTTAEAAAIAAVLPTGAMPDRELRQVGGAVVDSVVGRVRQRRRRGDRTRA
ncbi:hypothetical protein FNV62_00205 [Streptomyces sp. RLB3-17]|uniref:hypothetical protein n=1 Tax=unclassified Streptomyces TaxID=2593676 RepID=UPI001161CF9F|nr:MULTISPECIES: hypothetical protein [unclassified Streptomyces]QDN95046.1 hypothetical protein FNV58_01615 [Streptomyces sp. RLB1-9]QDO16770.1 hypothetical protein FNV65_00185 [Streptomyces sp. S1A1-8]QDO26893.1 hypothetical protein FNV63_00180 [Streptomyces sp. S1A1-3]QDO36933.1 hypothetical protein FNV62_00205 [Streptomyces sp. RLB3-17]